MTLDEIKQLIEFIKTHDLSEFELEHDGVKIRVKAGGNHHHASPWHRGHPAAGRKSARRLRRWH